MEFSPELARTIRETRGLNRVAASKAAGLSRQGLINIEDGGSVPSVATLARLADAYKAPVEEFFIHEPEATEPSTGRGSASPGTDNEAGAAYHSSGADLARHGA